MGEIYLAEDQVLGRKVAVKVLAERFARDDAVRRRFTREALTAARLSGHPHIVTIFDVGECEGRPFIVMEYLAGGTLADRARHGAIDHDRAIEWLKQAAEALDDAHRQGIVHRDVKPANLLFDSRGELHVADFGIARVLDESTTGMTMAGTILGTAGYLSPEQARGEPATSASDIYSLGIVAYELLTGGRPFEDGSATAEAAAHIHQPVPPASERGVGLPREVDAVFERVLAKDPARRYGTARAFIRALCLALEAGTEPTRVAAPTRPTATRPTVRAVPARKVQRRSYLPVLAAAAVAALALGGVVLAAVWADNGTGGNRQTGATEAGEPRVITKEVAGPGTTVVQTVTTTQAPATTAPTAQQTTQPPPAVGGAKKLTVDEARALVDQSTYLMRSGRYGEALPVAQRALARLRGTGDTYEGYANFNVGNSLAYLGRCKDAIPYLERREQMLGPHAAVTAAKRRCGAA